MSNQLYIGTRKGLFTINRTPAGWKIAKVDFLAQNVTMLLQDPARWLVVRCFGSRTFWGQVSQVIGSGGDLGSNVPSRCSLRLPTMT